MRTHLNKQRSSNVILQILDGSTWPVNFKYDITRGFQNGWSVFARESNLKVGDLCVFEMINRNELTFEVVFFRATGAKKCSLSAGKSVHLLVYTSPLCLHRNLDSSISL